MMVVAGDLESLYEHLADGLSLLHTYLEGDAALDELQRFQLLLGIYVFEDLYSAIIHSGDELLVYAV